MSPLKQPLYKPVGIVLSLIAAMVASNLASAQTRLDDINFGWRFSKGDQPAAVAPSFDDSGWERVDLPQDWAISGPFG
jgi:beta-galactosidase